MKHETNVLESDNKLKYIRKHNLNKIILAYFNVNSMRNRFYSLIYRVDANVDVLMVTKPKINQSY